MKKRTAFVLSVLGVLLFLTGCAANSDPFAAQSYTADVERVTAIRIDVRDREIAVSPSNDGLIHIDYHQNSKEYYDIAVSGNVLTMTSASNKSWTDYIGAKPAADQRKILLQIPPHSLAALSLSTTNEDISLPALSVTGEISLSVNGGDIRFAPVAGNALAINAKNGNIHGQIAGSYEDYAIDCAIKKGESNLPSRKDSGSKTLRVTNNNGDIDIEFVRE